MNINMNLLDNIYIVCRIIYQQFLTKKKFDESFTIIFQIYLYYDFLS